ncbi:AMP-binding protein [Vibrio lamellibrachiae]|uniref:AMP-binding protein n=1 Tax=Vibrio lamellibrachiae TaxID=2910253 RepID=UPI003D1082F4
MTKNSELFCSLRQLMNATRSHSHSVAFSSEHSWTWPQFRHDVNQLVLNLNGLQAQKVALCSTDTYQFTVGFFALCHSGKTIVLPGNYQSSALAELSSQFELLLCDSDIAHSLDNKASNENNGENIRQMLLPATLLEPSLAAHSKDKLASFEPLRLDDVLIILFTSGSSGQPKAINKTLKQLDTEINVLEQQWGPQLASCIIESTVSHQHIYGLLFRVLWPLCAGRAFNTINLEYPEQVISHSNNDTLLVSSPALLKRLSNQQATTCRMVFSSGGPLPYKAAQTSKQLLSNYPVEVFGSTETGGIAFRCQEAQEQPWQLFPAIDAELNSEGCLRLKSPYIDISRWYQTTDQCEMVGDCQFLLKGRSDRVVKIEEKRVSLVEVEKRLEQLQWIEESAVVPIQESTRLTLVAAIVLTESGMQKLTEIGKGKFWILLRSELRHWLEPISIPKRFRILNEIPLNSQGKRLVAQIETLFE